MYEKRDNQEARIVHNTAAANPLMTPAVPVSYLSFAFPISRSRSSLMGAQASLACGFSDLDLSGLDGRGYAEIASRSSLSCC